MSTAQNDDDKFEDFFGEKGIEDKRAYEMPTSGSVEFLGICKAATEIISQGLNIEDSQDRLSEPLMFISVDKCVELVSEHLIASATGDSRCSDKTHEAYGIMNVLGELYNHQEGFRSKTTTEEEKYRNGQIAMWRINCAYKLDWFIQSRGAGEVPQWDLYDNVDDYYVWRSDITERYQSGLIDFLPRLFVRICAVNKLLEMRAEGGIQAMTSAKQGMSKEALIKRRKTKLIDTANKQIRLIENYIETGGYDRTNMKNNWFTVQGDKIKIVPRIGAYPVIRLIEKGVLLEGGRGWENLTPADAIGKIRGFLLALEGNKYDEHILNMFRSIGDLQKELSKQNTSKGPND